MSNLLPIIIAFILFLLIAGSFGVYALLQAGARKKAVLSKIKGKNAAQSAAANVLGDDPNKRRADLAKKLKDDAEENDEKKNKATLSMLIEQAGLSISMMQYWVFSVVSMGVFVGLAKAFEKGPVILGLAAVIGLLGFPRFILKKLAAKRQKEFLTEFPDALEATVRLLKAGMPVAEAVSMISREYEGPVGEEMGRIYDKQKIGIPMHEAAYEATRRMPLTEMQMFATGLAIQAQTGSSLSEVLMNLSSVIRSRFRLKRKVKALSSEAVASASIIASLPILVGLALYFVKYEYISVMFTDPTGKMLMTGAVVWMGVGVFAMKQMINFKI